MALGVPILKHFRVEAATKTGFTVPPDKLRWRENNKEH